MKQKHNTLLIEIYQDKRKYWRWRMCRCGRILAESGEGYGRLRDLERALTHLIESLGTDDYELVDPHHRAKPLPQKCCLDKRHR